MQFGRDNIFELLCNVYKANRDITDWSGNKPLDYRRQRTTVSASTYSKIKAKKKNIEKDSGFLRIGSLNVRVKKTTEAFSNFLGVGGSNGNTNQNNNHHHYHHQNQLQSGMMPPPSQNPRAHQMRASIPVHLSNNNNNNDKIHKTWGSVDNIPKPYDKNMPPPSKNSKRNSKTKRSQDGFNSMPSTPNQLTTDKKFLSHDQKIIFQDSDDSDSAAGFDSSWSKAKF
ncbi:homeobox protein 9-like [Condylostylus longicornis]|uniref:homeobox protein 9-like n=1 Tax=Condylostylus longicornis TaxID=2530218 RepID=UPI00244DCEB1|nr:homeobox protein 9-like [Condylostylus longicornis]